MKYDIYFHNDFDGRASAAVMLAFLRSRGDDIEHYVPVEYDLMPQWMDENFFDKHTIFKGRRNPAIVVDFPFHPQAAFWFDHHGTPFRKKGWDKKFKPSKFHHYDSGYRSACHLVYDSLKKDFEWKPSAHFKELVKWLDILDGARYSSARQTIEMKEPALRINVFINRLPSGKISAVDRWIIGLLSVKPLAHIARVPKIKRVADTAQNKVKSGLAYYKRNIKVFGNVGYIDLSKKPLDGLRFAAYYLYPQLPYFIRLTKDAMYHMSVGYSPWIKKPNKVNIGDFLSRYGGGGHKNVGGCEFESYSMAMKAVDEMVIFFNQQK